MRDVKLCMVKFYENDLYKDMLAKTANADCMNLSCNMLNCRNDTSVECFECGHVNTNDE